jgi:hypothetical protein
LNEIEKQVDEATVGGRRAYNTSKKLNQSIEQVNRNKCKTTLISKEEESLSHITRGQPI